MKADEAPSQSWQDQSQHTSFSFADDRLDDTSVVLVSHVAHQLAYSNTSGLMMRKQFELSGSAGLKENISPLRSESLVVVFHCNCLINEGSI